MLDQINARIEEQKNKEEADNISQESIENYNIEEFCNEIE
jgi:hypothetical protein